VVRAEEEHPVIVDNADAKAVKPTGPAKEVPVECWILSEEGNRGELDVERLNCDLVLIGGKRSSHGPKTLKPARFYGQTQHLSVFALEDAICSARIQFG